MKKLPLDVSTFETLIKGGYLYVDKTRDIHTLITTGRYYFLSRPRRFGKTLLVSTLEEIFSGNRDLFKGLWIDSSDYSWDKHPVITFDFSTIDSSSPEAFKKALDLELEDKADELEVTLPTGGGSARKLKNLVRQLAKKNKVVILIDEYDYPLVNILDNPEVLKGNLKIISNFFTAIKGLDKHLRALFITGVSQIPKASIFSGLNNPNNISLDPMAATLLGYTKEELVTYFSEHITQLALLEQKPQEDLLKAIQQWYNGYQFSEKDSKVYNPFSVHYLFTKKKFDNYWFDSATPKF
nr:AAA family ATPase [Candidatus Dependentiae bacterium]